MTTWNRRFLPHPLLAPWTYDYTGASFSASTPHAVRDANGDINVTIKYNLTSACLRGLIADGQAKYTSVVSCAGTFKRFATEPSSGEDEDIFVKSASDYTGELRLSPYVVATKEIAGFLSDEHAEEFREFNPCGYEIRPWSILAAGASVQIALETGDSLNSAIDLVANRAVKDGSFRVDVNENRIKIQVSPDDKAQIELLRQKEFSHPGRAALFPAVYLHAITEALRNLSEHEDKLWHDAVRSSLSRRGVEADDDDLRDRALVHAQTLMDSPIGMFLKAHSSEQE